jgi:glutamate carboxypeptidase
MDEIILKIVEYLEDQRSDMLEMIETVVNMDSPSSDKATCDRLIRYVAEVCSSIVDKIEIVPMAEYGDCLMATVGSGTGQVLVLSHLDTVWPQGETARRPFSIRNGRATGPGVFDMKAGAIQGIWAVKALKDIRILPDRPIRLFFNCDEEVGSVASRALIEAEAKKTAAVLCLEPSVEGKVKIERKGTGMFHMTVEGRAAHSGADHQNGVNANLELAHQIIRLEGLTDYTTGTTINVGLIKGGQVRNQSAARAEALIDMRYQTLEEGRRIEKVIHSLESVLSGTKVKVTGGISRPPLLPTPGNQALFERAKRVAREIGFGLEGGKTGGGSDGSFTSNLGVSTLDGMGAVGAGGHALTEYIELDHLIPRTALIAGLMKTI